MLIQFSVGNFLSFKDNVTFSMVASSIKEHRDTNVFEIGKKMKLLKSAVIYGANASGKSNLFRAMEFARNFIFVSSKETQVTEEIRVANFKLSMDTEGKPSFFEFIFSINGTKYRYGFEVDQEEVKREWLFYIPKTIEAKLFYREKNEIKIGSNFHEGKDFTDKTRKNALFLSVVAQFNGSISTSVLGWLKNLNIISGLDEIQYVDYTLKKFEDPNYRKEIIEFLKTADLGIDDFSVDEEELNLKTLPKEFERFLKFESLQDKIIKRKLQTIHRKFDGDGKVISSVKFELGSEESAGTKKLFAISGPVIDTLKNGKVLVIDELDSKMHPLLTQFLIRLFNSNIKNPRNAQLIFASHDASFLNKTFFRRDQIWFTEKNKFGATDLYSLVEYKREKGKIRKDASFSKDYLLGKYGATPNIGEIESLI